jgi:transporter family-2 protein
MDVVAIVAALLSGALLSLQLGMNGQVKVVSGHALWAAIVSFVVGLVALLALAAVLRPALPSGEKLTALPWWAWLGGTMGAVYVTAAAFLAPRLGLATLTALVVTGWLVSSIAIDHFGLVGAKVHAVNLWRVVGAGLLLVGAGMVLRN